MDKKSFSPSSGWNSVTFSTPPTFNADFFIVAFINPSGTVGMGIDNDGFTYEERMVQSDNASSWWGGYDLGDYMIRATVTYVSVEENGYSAGVELYQIAPNPVIGKTNISYELNALKEGTAVDLKIYDASGKLVKTLAEGVTGGGIRNVEWNKDDNRGNKVGSGIYFCRLAVGNTSILTRRVVVL